MDRSSEASFGRFWLPLILLGVLVLLLFPRFGPREQRTTRELWDGMVILASSANPAPEEWRLIATVPLRTTDATREEWVVGDARLLSGQTSVPLLLATPPKSSLHRRLTRRVQQDRSRPHTATVLVRLFRSEELPEDSESWLGSILRFPPPRSGDDAPTPIGKRISREGESRSLTESPWQESRTITLETSRERRWMGDPRTFSSDWERFRSEDPGGLSPFIHDRLPLPRPAALTGE